MKKLIILFLIASLIFTYFIFIKPYKEAQYIKNELRNKWDIDIEKLQRSLIAKNKPQWHGEQQKFILYNANMDDILPFIIKNNLHQQKVSKDVKERIIEIENELKIEDKYRVNFRGEYFFSERVKGVAIPQTEKKNDILYIILIKEDSIGKIFLIEDLNVLVLDR